MKELQSDQLWAHFPAESNCTRAAYNPFCCSFWITIFSYQFHHDYNLHFYHICLLGMLDCLKKTHKDLLNLSLTKSLLCVIYDFADVTSLSLWCSGSWMSLPHYFYNENCVPVRVSWSIVSVSLTGKKIGAADLIKPF